MRYSNSLLIECVRCVATRDDGSAGVQPPLDTPHECFNTTETTERRVTRSRFENMVCRAAFSDTVMHGGLSNGENGACDLGRYDSQTFRFANP